MWPPRRQPAGSQKPCASAEMPDACSARVCQPLGHGLQADLWVSTLVGVVLDGHLAVGLPDLVGTRALFHAEQLIEALVVDWLARAATPATRHATHASHLFEARRQSAEKHLRIEAGAGWEAQTAEGGAAHVLGYHYPRASARSSPLSLSASFSLRT
eukprot:scaffold159755_cov32-Tisochrysis_lutea.AAC.6